MGLDMFLFKTKRTNHSIDELKSLDRYDLTPEDEDVKDLLPLYESDYSKGKYCIFKEVSYWRKFNALHNWFVTNVQIGIDDCGMYEVTKDHVEDLLDTLFIVLEEKDPTDFMPVIGFFFGSNEVDEYYWEQVENTRDKMYRLLNDFDWENERLFYHSSW
jgi:hypothetical protein